MNGKWIYALGALLLAVGMFAGCQAGRTCPGGNCSGGACPTCSPGGIHGAPPQGTPGSSLNGAPYGGGMDRQPMPQGSGAF